MGFRNSLFENKKGIEMSINFIVILIISLTIFFFGARFIYKIGAESVNLETMTTEELDQKIGQLLCDNQERVCIGFDKIKVKRGKLGYFGIKILNVLDQRETFTLEISRPSPSGYTKSGNSIDSDDFKWMPNDPRAFEIERNEEKDIAIGVETPRNAQSGTYIFNLEITPYNEIYKLYVEVP